MYAYREIVTYPNLLPVIKLEWYEDESLDAFYLPSTPPPFYPRYKWAEIIWCNFLKPLLVLSVVLIVAKLELKLFINH
jgi:hypothetical protein